MRQFIAPLVISFLVPIHLALFASKAIAHQHLIIEDVKATVHLEPNDSPTARVPSFTWFHFVRPDGETVSLSDCNCAVVIYNQQNQPILRPQLTEADVAGHERPISTTITFPSAGTYRLVFTGQSRGEHFKPFQLTLPVVVRPQ